VVCHLYLPPCLSGWLAAARRAGWLRNPIREGIPKDGGELARVFAISCTPLARLADKCGCHLLSPRSGESLAAV
jgi:hypothetical protein